MVPAATHTRIVLARRPSGAVVPGVHLVAERVPTPHPDALRDGECLVRVLWVSLDPAMRGWMNDRKSYIAPVALGDTMRANAVGEVVASKAAAYPPTRLVVGLLGLQEYAVVAAKDLTPCDIPPPFSPSTALGVFGLTGLTAYFGLLDVGRPRAGETVVVSAAAGATGSVVAQIAQHVLGCRVVGIAGGPEKCAWLRTELGIGAAVDYRDAGGFPAALAAAAPDGIDVFFDNVGGAVLDEALKHLNRGARVVLCGAISGYNSPTGPRGPANYLSLLVNRARMEGFIVFDYQHRYAAAQRDLIRWAQEGRLQHREEVVEGLAHAPAALLCLFSGEHTGKLVVRVANPTPPPPSSKL